SRYKYSNKMYKLLLYLLCVVNLSKQEDDVYNIFPSLPVVIEKSENKLCQQHNEEYLDSLKNLTLWAHEMRDASMKSATGVLRGSIYNLGDFTQCLSARAPFPTQYCLITITANIQQPKSARNPFSLNFQPDELLLNRLYKYPDVSQQSRNVVKMGRCIPASCTPLEIEKFTNDHLNKTENILKKHNVTYTAQVPQILCTSSNDVRSIDGASVTFCVLTATLLLLVAISTFWEHVMEFDKIHKSSFTCRLFLAFSAKQNFPDLNKCESSNKSLSILYGVKTFGMFMIILVHRFGTFVGGTVSNFDYVEESYRNALVSYLFRGDLFVDTFFVISGLLATYNLLNAFEKRIVNPGFIIFMRYLRLTPAYAFVIFYACTLFYQSGDGPLWNAVIGKEVQDCRESWWISLLYLSNYINTQHMCLPHTWYLPCDFHYFVVAVGLVLLIRKAKKCGLGIVLALIIVSILIHFVLIFVYKSSAFLRFYPSFLQNPKADRDYQLIYIKTHARATPYFIGVFAGYVYYKFKGCDRVLSKCYSTTVAIVSTILLLVCIYSAVIFYDPFHEYNALESATYGALHRVVWALGSFGLMYAISFGTLSFLYKCLSWSAWVPLSKLVYGAYLVHFLFQMRESAKARHSVVFNFFDIVLTALGDIVLAFILSLGLYLTVEAPVRRVLKEILVPDKGKGQHSNTEQNTPAKAINRVHH
ncbi:hypothetical protein NQ315_009725, partial [Exocentrus adspersus]